ncbi:unnamed protein product [Caenorhabditis auriculariae]|uniref:SXP/RAL-2 family protein Ani s 5-like cation-binding domain-containing protein n=1 Tax=Caenorhabditis auriculariae TaxID=2777116 RepID=A0A8S1HH18_9PELO|nr:unnamed protein product [Caenorhabditis auriculariae]
MRILLLFLVTFHFASAQFFSTILNHAKNQSSWFNGASDSAKNSSLNGLWNNFTQGVSSENASIFPAVFIDISGPGNNKSDSGNFWNSFIPKNGSDLNGMWNNFTQGFANKNGSDFFGMFTKNGTDLSGAWNNFTQGFANKNGSDFFGPFPNGTVITGLWNNFTKGKDGSDFMATFPNGTVITGMWNNFTQGFGPQNVSDFFSRFGNNTFWQDKGPRSSVDSFVPFLANASTEAKVAFYALAPQAANLTIQDFQDKIGEWAAKFNLTEDVDKFNKNAEDTLIAAENNASKTIIAMSAVLDNIKAISNNKNQTYSEMHKAITNYIDSLDPLTREMAVALFRALMPPEIRNNPMVRAHRAQECFQNLADQGNGGPRSVVEAPHVAQSDYAGVNDGADQNINFTNMFNKLDPGNMTDEQRATLGARATMLEKMYNRPGQTEEQRTIMRNAVSTFYKSYLDNMSERPIIGTTEIDGEAYYDIKDAATGSIIQQRVAHRPRPEAAEIVDDDYIVPLPEEKKPARNVNNHKKPAGGQHGNHKDNDVQGAGYSHQVVSFRAAKPQPDEDDEDYVVPLEKSQRIKVPTHANHQTLKNPAEKDGLSGSVHQVVSYRSKAPKDADDEVVPLPVPHDRMAPHPTHKKANPANHPEKHDNVAEVSVQQQIQDSNNGHNIDKLRETTTTTPRRKLLAEAPSATSCSLSYSSRAPGRIVRVENKGLKMGSKMTAA